MNNIHFAPANSWLRLIVASGDVLSIELACLWMVTSWIKNCDEGRRKSQNRTRRVREQRSALKIVEAGRRTELCYNLSSLPGRYRLGVRTEDSQSSNPGSIPGSATSYHPLEPAKSAGFLFAQKPCCVHLAVVQSLLLLFPNLPLSGSSPTVISASFRPRKWCLDSSNSGSLVAIRERERRAGPRGRLAVSLLVIPPSSHRVGSCQHG